MEATVIVKSYRARVRLRAGLITWALIGLMSSVSLAANNDAPTIKPEDIKNALGMSFYLQMGYTFNGHASTPGDASAENDLRLFDRTAKRMTMDLAEIVFSREPKNGVVGYKIKGAAGEVANEVQALSMSSSVSGTARSSSFNIVEAEVSYVAPLGKGVRISAGKTESFLGAEKLEAIDNPNYSRSFLFTYAKPIMQTGIGASSVLGQRANAALYLLNGWDDLSDYSKGKAVGLHVDTVAVRGTVLQANYFYGIRDTNSARDGRDVLDLIATLTPAKPFSITVNYDSGWLQDAVPTGTAKWSGVSAVARYAINDAYACSVRGETFRDADGFRTGTQQTLTEYTVTPEVRLAGGLVLRLEYRHDSSNKQSFNNNSKNYQDTGSVAALYKW
jgi:hypothetical protein